MSASTFRAERAIPSTSLQAGAAAPANTGVFHRPSLTTTVPKEFVHRASVAEVMLTDWDRSGDDRFTVSAQWPRRHSFFTTDDRYSPLIAAETIRQAGILLAHTEYGVPLDQRFLVGDISVSARPEHFGVGWTPATLELDVTVLEAKRRGGTLTGLGVTVEIRRDGRPAAAGGGSFTCVTPPVYRRLRAPHLSKDGRPRVMALTAPVPPQSVGRISPTDVVLSPTQEPGRWQLRVDTGHPVLFDHPVDHVPGMMLLEAARQATVATLGPSCTPLEITVEFTRYTELSSPCVIETRRLPGTGTHPVQSVLVTGHQNGELVFRSTATASFVPD